MFMINWMFAGFTRTATRIFTEPKILLLHTTIYIILIFVEIACWKYALDARNLSWEMENGEAGALSKLEWSIWFLFFSCFSMNAFYLPMTLMIGGVGFARQCKSSKEECGIECQSGNTDAAN